MKLILPVPPGVNAMYRTWRGRMLLSAKGREYKARAALLARAQGARPFVGLRLSVTLRIYRPRRAGDIDGYLKGCFDALNGIAWEDDSQICALRMERHDDKAHPRVEIEIWQLGPEPEPKPRPLHPKRNLKRLVLTPAVYRKGSP